MDGLGPPQAIDSEAQARTPEHLFKMFVGPNAEKFQPNFARVFIENNPSPAFLRETNWYATLFGPAWFLYRKMYLLAAAQLAVLLLPSFLYESAKGIIPCMVIGSWASHLYALYAKYKIGRIEALDLPESERDARIRKAGGVSIAGVLVGAVLFQIFAAGNIASAFAVLWLHRQFPACNSPTVIQTTQRFLTAELRKDLDFGTVFIIQSKKQTENMLEGYRHCSVQYRVDDGKDLTISIRLYISDHNSGRVMLQLLKGTG